MSIVATMQGLARYYDRRVRDLECDFFLDEIIAADLIERCLDIAPPPRQIVEVGTRMGAMTELLTHHFKTSTVTAVECCQAMLDHALERCATRPCGVRLDSDALPFADHSVDMVVANLSFSFWPFSLVRECLRVLKPDGALILSVFGQDNLKELQEISQASQTPLRLSIEPDILQLGDAIVAQRGQDPTIHVNQQTLAYPDLNALRLDLQKAGLSYRSGEPMPARFISSQHEELARAYACKEDNKQASLGITVQWLTAVSFTRSSRPDNLATNEQPLVRR